jgi:pimeloyl-ACP methyl ester carboxylesterase
MITASDKSRPPAITERVLAENSTEFELTTAPTLPWPRAADLCPLTLRPKPGCSWLGWTCSYMSWNWGGILAVFVLIHGGGSTAWDWHLVKPLLEASGHDVIAVDLPIEDDNAGLEDYTHAVTAAVGGAQHTIVVGHSLGGFTAPLVCDELQSDGLVYLAGMIPLPGETFGDWWTNTGQGARPARCMDGTALAWSAASGRPHQGNIVP